MFFPVWSPTHTTRPHAAGVVVGVKVGEEDIVGVTLGLTPGVRVLEGVPTGEGLEEVVLALVGVGVTLLDSDAGVGETEGVGKGDAGPHVSTRTAFESLTNTVEPTTTRPVGLLKAAREAQPPVTPAAPEPASVLVAPVPSSATARMTLPSATSKRPLAASSARPVGLRKPTLVEAAASV